MYRLLMLSIGALLAAASATASAQNQAQSAQSGAVDQGQAGSASKQPAASGIDQVRGQHDRQTGIPVHGNSPAAESGRTAPGTNAASAERIGAEPTGVTPPVPAPTVGSTGGGVPYAR